MLSVVACIIALTTVTGRTPLKYRGNDVSFIPQVEAGGGVYRDEGAIADPFAIYKRHGLNVARIRVWVNPPDSWCDEAHTLALAKRAAGAGMRLYIDFHYSDTWADPGKQPKPKAWLNDHGEALEKDVYDHTFHVVHALVDQGTPPTLVSVGNEVRVGMLWPDGRLDGSDKKWKVFAGLFNAGARAVRAAMGRSQAPVLLHNDQGADRAGCENYYSRAMAEGMKFDLIGLSYYPWWHGPLDALKANLENLSSRFKQKVWVVETSYPFTMDRMSGGFHMFGDAKNIVPGYPATQEGQSAFLRRLAEIIGSTSHGEGLVYWAGDWLKVPTGESTWENMNLFDGNGNVLPSMDALGR